MKPIAQYLALLFLVPALSSTSDAASTDKKEFNEIFLDLNQITSTMTTPPQPPSKPTKKTTLDQPETQNKNASDKNEISLENTLIKLNQEFEIQKAKNKAASNLLGTSQLQSLPGVKKESHSVKKSTENDARNDLKTELSSGSSVSRFETRKPKMGIQEDTDDRLNSGSRVKKQVLPDTVKFSEPKPYEYNFQDTTKGTYSFGYGMYDQYRDEMRTSDGAVVGSYGWVDEGGTWHETSFLADEKGYRLLSPGRRQVGGQKPLQSTEKGSPLNIPVLKASPYMAHSPYGESYVEPDQANTNSNTKINTKSNIKLNTNSNTKINTKSNTKSNTKINTNSNTNSNTKINTNSNTKVNTKSNTKINIGQKFNPSVQGDALFGENEHKKEEKKEEENEEENEEEETVDDDEKYVSPFHTFDFLNAGQNRHNLKTSSHQTLSQKASDVNKEEGKFKLPFFPSKDQDPFTSFPLPSAKPHNSKITDGDTITRINLQDSFFSGLPLKPPKPLSAPPLNKPFEKSPTKLTKWPQITWPVKGEKKSKPALTSNNQLMGRSSGVGPLSTKDNRQSDDVNIGKSIYDHLKNTPKILSSYSTEVPYVPRNPRITLGQYPYMSPNNLQFNPINKRQFMYRNGGYHHDRTPLHPAVMSRNQFQYGFLPPNIYQNYSPYINENIYPNPYIRATPVIYNVVPIYTNNVQPLMGNYGNRKVPINPYNYLFDPISNVQGIPIYPPVMKPPPYVKTFVINSVHTIHEITHPIPLYKPEHTEDDMDYLLLSNEFKEVNGSITNDPAFVDIEDHFSADETPESLDHYEEDKIIEDVSPVVDDGSEIVTISSEVSEMEDTVIDDVSETNVTDNANYISSTLTEKLKETFKMSIPLLSNRVSIPLHLAPSAHVKDEGENRKHFTEDSDLKIHPIKPSEMTKSPQNDFATDKSSESGVKNKSNIFKHSKLNIKEKKVKERYSPDVLEDIISNDFLSKLLRNIFDNHRLKYDRQGKLIIY